MAYDEHLAERVRDLLVAEPDLTEKKMFGGLEMKGRTMTGWLLVDLGSLGRRAQLARWVDRGVAFARTLPPK